MDLTQYSIFAKDLQHFTDRRGVWLGYSQYSRQISFSLCSLVEKLYWH